MGVQVSGGKQLKFFSFQKCFFKENINWVGYIIKENLYLWWYWKSSMKPLANESLTKLKIGNMQQQNFIKSWQKIKQYDIKS